MKWWNEIILIIKKNVNEQLSSIVLMFCACVYLYLPHCILITQLVIRWGLSNEYLLEYMPAYNKSGSSGFEHGECVACLYDNLNCLSNEYLLEYMPAYNKSGSSGFGHSVACLYDNLNVFSSAKHDSCETFSNLLHCKWQSCYRIHQWCSSCMLIYEVVVCFRILPQVTIDLEFKVLGVYLTC